MANTPEFTLTELLEAGVHFGHKTQRWNPAMAEYIYAARNGIHIIDLRKTVPMLYQAMTTVKNIVSGGGRVLFVGTKTQAQEILKEHANRCGQYFIAHRWLGGTLTNWNTISQSIKRLKDLEQDFASAAEVEAKLAELQEGESLQLTARQKAFLNRTKKEKLMLQREYDKLNLVLGGIKDMGGLPDVVIVFDVRQEKIAVAEAKHLGIPVIGITDTNTDPNVVDFPIPGNDDSTRAIRLYARLFADSVLAGLESQAASSSSSLKSAMSAPATSDSSRETKVTLSPAAQKAAEEAEQAAAAEAEASAESSESEAPTAASKDADKAEKQAKAS